MPHGVPTYRPLPKQEEPAKRQPWTKERRSAYQRGYTRKWQKARAWYLLEHPLCVTCEQQGRLIPATQVDHVQPHKGDMDRFWDTDNWQGLCASCHSVKTNQEIAGEHDPDAHVVICGQPGVGKSTYAYGNAGPKDIVWDYDAIEEAMTGGTGNPALTPILERLRQTVIEWAASHKEPKVWMIVKRRDSADAMAKRMKACVLEMRCDEAERLRRIEARDGGGR